jgi:UDP-galactopyranose mutase
MDIELLAGVADARPDWHLVIIGPVIKIDAADLPRRANIHYLGSKQYAELPAYLSGWDVALLPFALNESTRFISPTKTPEYLSAGRPVVSTSIRDVVRPYGQLNLVRIADTVEEFVAASSEAMSEDAGKRMREVDAFLAETSWDRTWGRMSELIEDVMTLKRVTKTELATGIPGNGGARTRAVSAAAASSYASGD